MNKAELVVPLACTSKLRRIRVENRLVVVRAVGLR